MRKSPTCLLFIILVFLSSCGEESRWIRGGGDEGGDVTAPLAYRYDSDSRLLSVAFRFDSTTDMRIDLGAFGPNGLFDIQQIFLAPGGGDSVSLSRSWISISNSGSDWVGPYRVAAVDGPTATARFTGGTHGTSGVTGDPTARLLDLAIAIDGSTISGSTSGRGHAIEIVAKNAVQAYNVEREVLEATIRFRVTAGVVEVDHDAQFLEPVRLEWYYGMQAPAYSFNESIHFVGGQAKARETIASSMEAGPSGTHTVGPIMLRSGVRELILWLDPTHGDAADRQIADSATMATYSGSKAYHILVSRATTKETGDHLRWRGAYAFQVKPAEQTNVDTIYRVVDNGQNRYACVFLAAGSCVVPVVSDDIGKTVVVLSGSGDTETTAAGWQTRSTDYGLAEMRVE